VPADTATQIDAKLQLCARCRTSRVSDWSGPLMARAETSTTGLVPTAAPGSRCGASKQAVCAHHAGCMTPTCRVRDARSNAHRVRGARGSAQADGHCAGGCRPHGPLPAALATPCLGSLGSESAALPHATAHTDASRRLHIRPHSPRARAHGPSRRHRPPGPPTPRPQARLLHLIASLETGARSRHRGAPRFFSRQKSSRTRHTRKAPARRAHAARTLAVDFFHGLLL